MTADLRETCRAELALLRGLGRHRSLSVLSHGPGGAVERAGRSLLNLSSNDYLGLGADEQLLRAFLRDTPEEILDERGMTASSSRLLTGTGPACAALEEELAALYGGRECLIFSSGYHANLGILTALGRKGDLFLSDRLNHASIIDGMRLSEAEFRRYRHRDYDHLGDLLRAAAGRPGRTFIVTESVFSMDGDLADLAALARLKERYGATLVVDEAHAVGVFGERGRGLAEAAGVLDAVDILVGTFGKALASLGAFAVTAAPLKEYFVNTVRPFIFTTALPPAVLSWSRLTLRRMQGMGRERLELAALGRRLRGELAARGRSTGGDSQIVPVIAGEDEAAARLALRLQEAGYLVLPIRPPTVPPGTARVRLSLTAAVRWDDLRALPDAVGGPGS
jgi:8-amino-7-oxononanoate synthase